MFHHYDADVYAQNPVNDDVSSDTIARNYLATMTSKSAGLRSRHIARLPIQHVQG